MSSLLDPFTRLNLIFRKLTTGARHRRFSIHVLDHNHKVGFIVAGQETSALKIGCAESAGPLN